MARIEWVKHLNKIPRKRNRIVGAKLETGVLQQDNDTKRAVKKLYSMNSAPRPRNQLSRFVGGSTPRARRQLANQRAQPADLDSEPVAVVFFDSVSMQALLDLDARMVPCPWAKLKRCPKCGPKNGLCKARECAAARKPLLLGFNPAVGAQEGA